MGLTVKEQQKSVEGNDMRLAVNSGWKTWTKELLNRLLVCIIHAVQP